MNTERNDGTSRASGKRMKPAASARRIERKQIKPREGERDASEIPRGVATTRAPERNAARLIAFLFPSHDAQTLSVQLEQVRGVLLGLRCGAALLESYTAAAGSALAIAGRHSNELHQIE